MSAEQGDARHRQRQRAARAGHRTCLRPVAIATAGLVALVRLGAERRAQFLLDSRFDRAAHVFVDQLPQRDSLDIMRSGRVPGTWAHRAFLRWLPLPGGALVVNCTTGRMRLFSHTNRDAAQDDLGVLWNFLAMAAYETDAEAAKAVPRVAKYLVGWQRPGDFGFIAEQNGENIGAAWA